MKSILLVTFALIISSNSIAQSINYDSYIQKLIEISKIQSNDERLKEYDSLVVNINSFLNSPPTEDNGKWLIHTKINPLDDSEIFTAYVEASEGRNEYGEKPVFYLRCQSNKINTFIDWSQYLGSNAEVMYRIGKGKPISREWALSTNSQATFYPKKNDPFVRDLQLHDTFVARITPYNSNPITAVFDISGGNDVFDKLLACGR